MKKLWKIILWVVVILVLIVGGSIVYITGFLPDISYDKTLKVEITPQRVQRGEYLANHVALCMDCHSTRNWNLFAAPPEPGTLGVGGEVFDKKQGLPGTFVSRNLTPYHLKDYSDGEIYRAITSGVGKNGRPLFPVMPYDGYGKMDNEDVFSIIAYLRTLSPIESSPVASKADFPMNIIIHTIPAKGTPQAKPPESDTLAYGKYMVTAGACIECHTPLVRGQLVPGKSFSGGRPFPVPTGGVVTSANITPDKLTGIGEWTEEAFVARFKAYDPQNFDPPEIQKDQFQTVMPWTMYAGMKESDLRAIFKYLHSLKPIENKVVKFSSNE